MKTEDFERLKKLCDENGFELVTESPNDNEKFFVVRKKDEWEGVEFVDRKTSFWPICKIHSIETDRVFYYDIGGKICSWWKDGLNPSTEQAYVEQLKKEAFERFGEIKEGDNFKDLDGYVFTISKTGFTYFKNDDSLCIGGVIVYHKCKWAEKVKERISIRWEECDGNYIKFSYSGSVNLIPRMNELAEVLEKYLNNEIE